MICPILNANSIGWVDCPKEKCAWWVVVYDGLGAEREPDKEHCVIHDIGKQQ